jgi:hypothetical protein
MTVRQHFAAHAIEFFARGWQLAAPGEIVGKSLLAADVLIGQRGSADGPLTERDEIAAHVMIGLIHHRSGGYRDADDMSDDARRAYKLADELLAAT